MPAVRNTKSKLNHFPALIFFRTAFRTLPTVAGQVVDLQALYNTVLAYGGWDKVNDRQLWSSVAHHFGIDSTCLNGTQALKHIYIR